MQADGRARCPHRAVIGNRITIVARRAGDSAPYRRKDRLDDSIRLHGQNRAELLVCFHAIAHAHPVRQLHLLPADLVEVAFDRAADL